jgi:hypothetical protein
MSTTTERAQLASWRAGFRFAALALVLGLLTAGVSRLYQARLNKAHEDEWFAAALNGKVQRLRDLTDAGVEINAARPGGRHVLEDAVELTTGPLVVKRLMEAGADPNASADAGRAPVLFWAIESGDSEVVRLLLAYGADPTRRSRDGRTALAVLRSARREWEWSDKSPSLGGGPKCPPEFDRIGRLLRAAQTEWTTRNRGTGRD